MGDGSLAHRTGQPKGYSAPRDALSRVSRLLSVGFSGDNCMDGLGTMMLPGYRFAAHTARMYRFTNDDEEERSGWAFFIATHPPFEEPPVAEGECGLFEGVALYAEDEPVPLPEAADFTGLDFFLKEPYRQDGEVYFTFNPMEAHDVSDVRIRFLDRDGLRYRVELSALVYRVFAEPTELRYSGWLEVSERQ